MGEKPDPQSIAGRRVPLTRHAIDPALPLPAPASAEAEPAAPLSAPGSLEMAPPTSVREKLMRPVGVTLDEKRHLHPSERLTDLERRVAGLQQLLTLAQQLSSIRVQESLLDAILDTVIPLASAERAMLLLVRDGDLDIVLGRNAGGQSLPRDISQISVTLARRSLEANRPEVHDDLTRRPELQQVKSIVLNDLYSAICLPLRDRGRPIGVLYLDSSRPILAAHSSFDLDLLEGFAAQAAICLVNSELIKRLEESREVLARENENLRAEVQGGWSVDGMVGSSPSMQLVFERLARIRDMEIAVLITGESGTGKDLIAHALHAGGPRAGAPFVTVNCGAIPNDLFESEFFGSKKGAFTGALVDRPGYVEQAAGGTLFLDEVGDLDPHHQVKLLRFLQSGEFRRVGENDVRHADTRVISATHRDLSGMIARGEFRQDLFYRLQGIRVELPPIRERREDMPLLIRHFFETVSKKHPHRSIRGIGPAAMEALLKHDWPGNVRELMHAIEGAFAMVPDGGMLDLEHLRLHVPLIAGRVVEKKGESGPLTLQEATTHAERECIQSALDGHGWNITHAARELGISRQHLHNRINMHKLQRPEGAPHSS